jgi:hypothetical protein
MTKEVIGRFEATPRGGLPTLSCELIRDGGNATVEEVHISAVRVGDTVIHNGHLKTVSRSSLGSDGLFGVTLWGDSYRAGSAFVKRVRFADVTECWETKARRDWGGRKEWNR